MFLQCFKSVDSVIVTCKKKIKSIIQNQNKKAVIESDVFEILCNISLKIH